LNLFAKPAKFQQQIMLSDTKTRILQRALEIIGSREDLARRLKARPIQLATWLGGLSPVPDDVFLKAVDIVLHEVPDADGPSLWDGDPPRAPKAQ
jgi:hypothetical protein